MTVDIGRRFPCAGPGKVILACLPGTAEPACRRTPALTERTVTSPDESVGSRADRPRRYAVTLGERQSGAGSVAAPLFGPDGELHGAISICGPEYRFTPELIDRYRTLIREAADEIQQNWGWLGKS